MKITKLELKNFKRFDDLTIDMTALAEPAKLVLLIGTNGSGKSSVFDAFGIVNNLQRRDEGIEPMLSEPMWAYYKKNVSQHHEISFIGDKGQTAFFTTVDLDSIKFVQVPINAFYGRTSIRQVPKLMRTSLGQHEPVSFEGDTDRPRIFIDRDNRFENDIEKVTSLILTDVFNGDTSTAKIKASYINPINVAFEHIFGLEENLAIKLISIIPPLGGKTSEILFEKGKSKIPYNFLSSGEKEIFNILLDLLVRKEFFQDSVYFLDEIDLHLNTYLQKNLLKEITENWVPDNCQLWTASHSLGFIEYANESEHAAIIDFDNLNFDIPQVITPSPKNNFDVFEIAVSKDFFSKVLEGKQIIFSENTDTVLYNNLSIANTVFFVARGKADVFYKTQSNASYFGLIDRDYLSDEERIDLLKQYKNLFILGYYSIENYLFHPDNLEEYCDNIKKEYNKEDYINAIESEWSNKKSKILYGVSGARGGYPFYKENENDPKLKEFKSSSSSILQMFESTDFETFFKVFPAKDYGTEIKGRQNLNRIELAKTKWFKTKIEEILTK